MRIRIVALQASVADEVRRTRRAPGYGHPVHEELAAGYGPCRSCLRPFREDVEQRLLFTYDPFRDIEALPLPGPIFVHRDSCRPYSSPDRFPETLGFIPMTLNAYGRGRRLADVAYLDPHADHEKSIAELLSRSGVDYVHVRNTEAGCYLFRVERSTVR